MPFVYLHLKKVHSFLFSPFVFSDRFGFFFLISSFDYRFFRSIMLPRRSFLQKNFSSTFYFYIVNFWLFFERFLFHRLKNIETKYLNITSNFFAIFFVSLNATVKIWAIYKLLREFLKCFACWKKNKENKWKKVFEALRYQDWVEYRYILKDKRMCVDRDILSVSEIFDSVFRWFM